MYIRCFVMTTLQVSILSTSSSVAAAPPKPVPPSPYLPLVYRYADAMLKQGRDTHGPKPTGLFLSALDRKDLVPLAQRPAAPTNVHESLRAAIATGPIVGASPAHDQNLLRLLYTLSELSSKPLYRDAADAELKWFLKNTPPGETCRAFGNLGYAWNVMSDERIANEAISSDRTTRPWMLWNRCFGLAPDESRRAVLVLGKETAKGKPSVQQAGFNIRAYAVAYQQSRDSAFITAIENELATLEKTFDKLDKNHENDSESSVALLSVAIDCNGAASLVTPTLATRLRALSARADHTFLDIPHDLKAKNGFVLATAENSPISSLWTAADSGRATAAIAMLCVSRYENTGSVGFRDLIHAAADAYHNAATREDADIWPMAFGHAISLQLTAWRSTSNKKYLDRAIQLADESVKIYWSDSPLPCASSKTKHYESITGADTLALALVELHLSILHITAAKTPPNTIDR